MIALAIEPSRVLWFASDGSGSVDNEAAIARFLQDLRAFTQELESHGCAVAVTGGMSKEFWRHVETVARGAGRYRQSLLFFYEHKYKVRLLVRVGSAWGEPIETIRLKDATGELQHPLLQSPVYREWMAVVGLIPAGQLPPVVIRGQTVTVFRRRELDIEAPSQVCNVCVEESVPSAVQASAAVARAVLAYKLATARLTYGEGTVHSTGGHSSIWERPIKRLRDVPDTHGARSLLEEMINYMGVREVTFLEFYQPCSASDNPVIRIRRVVAGDSGDVLEGSLHTTGKKQHCQDVALKVPPGLGELWRFAFPGGITLQGLEDVKARMRTLTPVQRAPA